MIYIVHDMSFIRGDPRKDRGSRRERKINPPCRDHTRTRILLGQESKAGPGAQGGSFRQLLHVPVIVGSTRFDGEMDFGPIAALAAGRGRRRRRSNALQTVSPDRRIPGTTTVG